MEMNHSERLGVRHSIEEWGLARDNGDWEALEQLFHRDGIIRVAWYYGHFKKFIELSKAGFGKSFSKHIICNSSIKLRGFRAFAETNVILVGRSDVRGVACHGETHMRFLDCLIRGQSDNWQIVDRTSVYDHDSLSPMVPTESIELSGSGAERWPVEYRYLAMRLSARALPVVEELPTKGSVAEAQIRLRCAEWLLQD